MDIEKFKAGALKQVKEHGLETVFAGHAMLANALLVWNGVQPATLAFFFPGNIYWIQRWIRKKEYGALALSSYYAALNIVGIVKYYMEHGN